MDFWIFETDILQVCKSRDYFLSTYNWQYCGFLFQFLFIFLFLIFPSRNCHSLLRRSLSYLRSVGEYLVFEYCTCIVLAFPTSLFRPKILKKGFVSWIRLRKFYKLVSNMWCSCCMRLMRMIKQLVQQGFQYGNSYGLHRSTNVTG